MVRPPETSEAKATVPEAVAVPEKRRVGINAVPLGAFSFENAVTSKVKVCAVVQAKARIRAVARTVRLAKSHCPVEVAGSADAAG